MCSANAKAIDNTLPGQAAEKQDELGWLSQLKFELVRGFLWGWAKCFSLRGLYLLGAGFAVCEWLINGKRRRRFRKNLKAGFGEAVKKFDRKTARRACLQQFIRIRCDKIFYLIFDKIPKEQILSRVRFPRETELAEAMQGGKGVYVCTSHIGSMHLVGLILALKGFRVAGVRDPKEGAIRRYIQCKYEKTFSEFSTMRILYSDAYPRDIYRCLQEGFVLGSSLDIGRERAPHLRTVTADVFGQPRKFLVGPIQIALRCGVPIYQIFMFSLRDFYFDLLFLGPLVDPRTATDTPETHQEIIKKYADNNAEQLAKHPDHISRT
ncbi:MAG: hypothetical protein GXY44_08940 [Phycisphaerales bacterium]|nr:hypothetical protein [Phycisphaerales bacterium]